MVAHAESQDILEGSLKDLIGERYVAYALSTIVARSLPDVRDGLKPAQRRLLYAMRELSLSATSPFKKSARIVGDVMGKFHPHGDASIYETMVKLSQSFSVRYPLVDGQGNFGNIDGDNAAAMRYTEARLTPAALMLMQGLDEDGADVIDTYDGNEKEPLLMPGPFPLLLANGSMGIAVGMATNMPPHNVANIAEALNVLIEVPETSVGDLVKIIKGPDFPTGGQVLESFDSLVAIYESGRGSVRLRSTWHVEQLERGAYQIVLTEIPYQVKKQRLIEQIAELIESKKNQLIEDIIDESAETMRIVIEPKTRSVTPEQIMASLFKNSDCEVKVAVNLNVLDAHGVPSVMSLKMLMQAFIDHRRLVTLRETAFHLAKNARRLAILGGYHIVFLNLDRVIEIIRHEDDANAVLKSEFDLTDAQVEAILNMRLGALRKLDELAIMKEIETLQKEQLRLEKLQNSPAEMRKKLIKENEMLLKMFGEAMPLGKRRTIFIDPSKDKLSAAIAEEVAIPKEPLTLVVTQKGWIRALKTHLPVDEVETKYLLKTEDALVKIVHAWTTDKLLVGTFSGQFFTVKCADLTPGTLARGQDDNLNLLFDLPKPEVTGGLLKTTPPTIVALEIFNEAQAYLLATHSGIGFIVKAADCVGSTKNGKAVMKVPAGDWLAFVEPFAMKEGPTLHLALLNSAKMLLTFPLSDVPVLEKGKGVILQKMKDARTVLMQVGLYDFKKGLRIGTKKSTEFLPMKPYLQSRATQGSLADTFTPSTKISKS